MSAHDRFEILCGAVMLGEATVDERALFEEHAATCAACREDAGYGTLVAANIAASRDAETWRPTQPIVDRLRAKHGARARRTVGVLGWAVAASLVLNVAFAGGAGSRMAGLFRSTAVPPADVAAQRLTLDAPRALAYEKPVVHVGIPVERVRAKKALAAHIAVAALKPHVEAASEKLPTLDDIPDQLAGLDLYGTGSAHHKVAIEAVPRCDVDAAGNAGAVTDVRPCRARSSLEHHFVAGRSNP